jgi:transcriptional regulator with GAF, ATPase, and Fis domain
MATSLVWQHYLDAAEEADAKRLQHALERLGIRTLSAPTVETEAGIFLANQLDSRHFLETVSRSEHGRVRVIVVVTGAAAADDHGVWQMLRCGSADVLRLHDPAETAAAVAARLERWRAVDELLRLPIVADNLVGQSPLWQAALRQTIEVGAFTNENVVLTGETGTGKELVARLVHTLDRRAKKGPLVLVDCTTIVPELAGSEFFGHEKGAYTSSIRERDGAFAQADGGTLFLDEVGELTLPLQAELLRVVQERTYKPVGGDRWRKSEFRLVCATHRDLTSAVRDGQFRSDLYYRLATCTVRLPALRERPEDILILAHHFLSLGASGRAPVLDPSLQRFLLDRAYPGNVRELRQLMAQVRIRHVGPGPVTVGDLPADERPAAGVEYDWRDGAVEVAIRRALLQGRSLREIGGGVEELAERIALGLEGTLKRAARRLGLTDRALQLRRARRRLPASAGD